MSSCLIVRPVLAKTERARSAIAANAELNGRHAWSRLVALLNAIVALAIPMVVAHPACRKLARAHAVVQVTEVALEAVALMLARVLRRDASVLAVAWRRVAAAQAHVGPRALVNDALAALALVVGAGETEAALRALGNAVKVLAKVALQAVRVRFARALIIERCLLVVHDSLELVRQID